MAAYNIGGATLGVSLIDTDNSDYTAVEMKQNCIFSSTSILRILAV